MMPALKRKRCKEPDVPLSTSPPVLAADVLFRVSQNAAKIKDFFPGIMTCNALPLVRFQFHVDPTQGSGINWVARGEPGCEGHD